MVPGHWHGTCVAAQAEATIRGQLSDGGKTMKWETPSYNDIRFGFEVTMYIYNR